MPPESDAADTVILVMTCRLSPPERLAAARRQLEAHLGEWIALFVQGAVAGDRAAAQLIDMDKARTWSKYPPTATEVACYASHRRCWEVLLGGSWKRALVLEDDFLLREPETVRQSLHAADSLLSQGRNLIKLFDYPRERSDDVGICQPVAGLTLMKWKRPRAGMVAYLISREGAERFLSRPKVFRVVDEDIKLFWELGLDVWCIPGNPVTDNGDALGGSLLEPARRGARRRQPVRVIKGLLLATYRNTFNHFAFRRATRRAGLTMRLGAGG